MSEVTTEGKQLEYMLQFRGIGQIWSRMLWLSACGKKIAGSTTWEYKGDVQRCCMRVCW